MTQQKGATKQQKRTKKKKRKGSLLYAVFKGLFVTIRFILKIPFYLLYGIVQASKAAHKTKEKATITKKRRAMTARYEPFRVLQTVSGDFTALEAHMFTSDSTIGIILGGRGTGKSALALKILENWYTQKHPHVYAMGFASQELPAWITAVENIQGIENNSVVVIDEGGILFSSRKSMSTANKVLSELLLVARHKNISILFISQNSSNLEVNILRQADYLFLKPSSLLQKNFERKIIKDLYEKTADDFKALQHNKGVLYVHADTFRGFVSNTLPSFWSTSLSKSWKDAKKDPKDI